MKVLIVALASISVLSAFFVGIAVGFKTGLNPADIFSGGGYQAGFNHARDLLIESGLVPPSQGKIDTLTGTVKSVNGKNVTIEVNGRIVHNPLDPQGPTERRLEISNDTEIIAMMPLSREELEAADKKFMEDMRAGKPATMPVMYNTQKKSVDDIKQGAVVTVTSADDISIAPTIKATKIVINSSPAPEVQPENPTVPQPVAPKK